MKIVNEKGKLFGVINVLDLCVLMALLLVVGGVAWQLFGSKVVSAAAPTSKMTVTMRVRGAHPRQLAEVEKNVPAQLVSGNDYIPNASLTKVSSEPYVVQNPTADGSIVESADPTRIDIIFTIEATVQAGGPIIKLGSQEIRAGRDYTVKTKYIEQSAIIETVNYSD